MIPFHLIADIAEMTLFTRFASGRFSCLVVRGNAVRRCVVKPVSMQRWIWELVA